MIIYFTTKYYEIFTVVQASYSRETELLSYCLDGIQSTCLIHLNIELIIYTIQENKLNYNKIEVKRNVIKAPNRKFDDVSVEKSCPAPIPADNSVELRYFE